MFNEYIKLCLGFKPDTPDDVVVKEWKRRTKHICKPCWELKYCPYGSLVENFPLETDESRDTEEVCLIFGHYCPVFFINEPLSEVGQLRKISRRVSRNMFLRIARRDNYTCQECGRHLKDNEIEIDHIIPISRGGSGEESNLRILCKACNRKKGSEIWVWQTS